MPPPTDREFSLLRDSLNAVATAANTTAGVVSDLREHLAERYLTKQEGASASTVKLLIGLVSVLITVMVALAGWVFSIASHLPPSHP